MTPEQITQLIERELAQWSQSPLVDQQLAKAALYDALAPLFAANVPAACAPGAIATPEG